MFNYNYETLRLYTNIVHKLDIQYSLRVMLRRNSSVCYFVQTNLWRLTYYTRKKKYF